MKANFFDIRETLRRESIMVICTNILEKNGGFKLL